jgi:hypothetical protein
MFRSGRFEARSGPGALRVAPPRTKPSKNMTETSLYAFTT